MARFKFRMQQMLNIKAQLEESIKNDLANALRTLEEEKHNLGLLYLDRESHIKTIRDGVSEGINVNKIKELNNYVDFLETKIENQKIVVNDAQEVADKIREKLIQISKEKKILEKLKEKQFQEFLAQEQKKEDLILGEVAGFKYIERKAGEDNGSR